MPKKWVSVNDYTIADMILKNQEKGFTQAVKSGLVPNTLQARVAFQTGTFGAGQGMFVGQTMNGQVPYYPGSTMPVPPNMQNFNGGQFGMPPGVYPTVGPAFNAPMPQILIATEMENNILNLILKKDFSNLLKVLTNYNNTERFDFWRNFVYNGTPFKSILMESIADYSRPMYIGVFLGGEYYDSAVLFEALEKRKEKFGIGIITFFKNIKKRIPGAAFNDLFGIEIYNYVSSRTDDKNPTIVTVLKTARVKVEKMTVEMPQLDIKKLFLRIENKEHSELLRMFVCYSKERITRMCHKYYAEYGMTVYEHCEKKGIDPLLVIYIRHLIPSCTSVVNYVAFLIKAYSKSDDGAYMIPYLLSTFMNDDIQSVINAYNMISVDTLQETITKIFDPNIAGYINAKILKSA